MDKRTFINSVDSQLGADFSATAEECVKAVFKVLHQRLEPGQAGHIGTHLPNDLKDDWKLGATESLSRVVSDDVQTRDRDEFLEAVRQNAGLNTTEEALQATQAVFSVLKQALPQKDVYDTASELPGPLREIWVEASL